MDEKNSRLHLSHFCIVIFKGERSGQPGKSETNGQQNINLYDELQPGGQRI